MKQFKVLRLAYNGRQFIPRTTDTMIGVADTSPGLERSDGPLYANDVQRIVDLIDALDVGGKVVIRRAADV